MRRACLSWLPIQIDSGLRVSVLTPIGTALIGLRKGGAITWVTRTGDERRLTVVDVRPPTAG